MLSRFGSCQIAKRHLCLNSYLTRMSRDIVLAVIDHELCHLLHSGHNGAFYSALSRFDPLYAQHRSLLRRELSPYLNYIRLESKARRPHPALNDFSSPIL
jgi:predicted metal-dependent hydrolase